MQMHYEIYEHVKGQWRWRLKAGNNRIIANSGEWYYNEADCEHAINLVKGSMNAPVYRV